MDTKTQIIQAAVWLFLKHGYNTVSVSDIASRAGVSKGGLYHHFISKEALAEAVVDFYTREFYLRVQSSMSNNNSTYDKLRAVFELSTPDRGIWSVPAVEHSPEERLEPSEVLRFLFEVARNNEHLRNRIARSNEKVIADLVNMLESGKKLGFVNRNIDSNHFALTIFSMHRGLLNLWAFNPDIDIDKTAQQMAEDLWQLVKS